MNKIMIPGQVWWYIAVIPSTQDVETGRIKAQGYSWAKMWGSL
jgi:hypothetical protein